MKKIKSKKAFTLVEILIVMVIIAVIAVLTVPKFLESYDVATARKAAEVLESVYNAQIRYSIDNPKSGTATPYTTNPDLLDVSFPGASVSSSGTITYDRFTITIHTGARNSSSSEHSNNYATSTLSGAQIIYDFEREERLCASSGTRASRICSELRLNAPDISGGYESGYEEGYY